MLYEVSTLVSGAPVKFKGQHQLNAALAIVTVFVITSYSIHYTKLYEFLTAAVVILLAIYFQTLLSFYDAFSSQGAGQTQAPLLLLVSLYLIYRTWDASGRRIVV